MAPQSRCKGCKWVVRECRGGPRPLLHSRRGLEGQGPRAVADPGSTHRAARGARRAAVPVDVRDRPGRGRSPPDPARAVDVAIRGRVRPRDRPAADGLLPHGAAPSGRRPARAPAGAARGVAARRARRAPLRGPARDSLALGRGHARGVWRGRRRLPRGPVDGGARAAAPEAPVDRERERRVLRPAGVARSITRWPWPSLSWTPAPASRTPSGGDASASRAWCCCSWTRTT